MTPHELNQYTAEHVQVIEEAHDLELLMEQPGWIVVERIFSQLQKTAHDMALNTPTDNPAAALDLLRKWQITDEVVSTIRATLVQRIQNAKDLAPETDEERQSLKELLHGRTDGDPIGN